MLTIDDINSIVEKYGDVGYWLSVPVSELPINEGDYIQVDILKITKLSANIKWRIYCDNAMFGGIGCFTKNGNLSSSSNISPRSNHEYEITLRGDVDTIHFYLSLNSIINGIEVHNGLLIFPISDLTVPIFNGNFDDRFYINPNGNTRITLDGVQVPLQTDEKGSYILLPSAKRWVLGTNLLSLYTITFKEFKTLPIPYIPTLYRGTPQSIQVLNTEDDDPISDYQTYYQGRQLKDNTIQLPYDSDEYVDIMVDLKDYRYPFCTLKLKAPTILYTADSQGDVETAIENGIQTLQVGDNQTEVTLNSITLSNVTLINSNIQLTDSTITDCQIIDTSYTDNGGNNITNTIFNSVDYTNTAQSNYNQVTFTECNIHDSEINLTGTISKSTITDTLILSDGLINIQDNTFTGVGVKEYFPSHLYLTGDYTVTGNTFNLTGEWTELEYNMCIIKATNDFNPSNFIKQNNLQLNITYDSEPVNTFYYNLVDEDKIRAVRLQ